MKYQASCHPGQLAFAFEGEFKEALACNCSLCRRHGIHTHGEGKDPTGRQVAAVNVRCIEGIDLDSLPIHHFDGRAL
ncbi:MAG TPA: hypothetical protein VK195_16420 [Burkholderiaceae bacterium]|nr:hypothetical protein [Burkholderiaceae bacterium]